MALTVVASGLLTATTGEQSLLNTTAAGTYVLNVNTKNMKTTSADETVLRVYTRVRSSDTGFVLMQEASYLFNQGDGADALALAEGDVAKASVPVVAPYGCAMSLIQLAGTMRDYPWNICSL